MASQPDFVAVREVPVGDRFGRFGTHAERDGTEYIATGYRCPEGPPGVSFTWHDLARRRVWGANLTEGEAVALDAQVRAALGGPPPRSGFRVAIDFRCPRCGRAVVVVFRDAPAGKDDWTYEPAAVFEVDSSRDIRAP